MSDHSRIHMLLRIWPGVVIACLLVGAMLCGGGRAGAADPPAPEKKPDWAALEKLLTSGSYQEAAVLAGEIAEMVKPKRRAPDFLPRTIEHIRALMRRGLALLRQGDIDAADDAFAEATRDFKDREFQRLLALEARNATAAVTSQMVMLDVNGVELADFRSLAVLERMRATNLARRDQSLSTAALTSLPQDVARWLGELKVDKRAGANARESLAERIEKGGPTVVASPYARAVAGAFRPEMIAGIAARELADMPPEVLQADAVRDWIGAGDEKPAEDSVPRVRARLLEESLGHFQLAAAALDEAIRAASPTGAAGLKGDARIEAALLEAEIMVHRGAAMKQAADLAHARESVRRAIQLHREVGELRRSPSPDVHPDLAWPLLLDADATLADAQRLLAVGDHERSQATVREASNTLARAAALPMPPNSPLRGYLADLQARLQRQRSALDDSLPRTEAADAAARRLQEAIDATALPGIAR